MPCPGRRSAAGTLHVRMFEVTTLKHNMTTAELDRLLRGCLHSEFSQDDMPSATDDQMYRALALVVRRILSERRKKFMAKTYGENGKQVYYLCMEFLMGRSLKTNLFNLGLNEVAAEVMASYDVKLDNLYELEPDAGLGNGGLGRLAACYLDACATTCLPDTGYSILYEYGIFRQKIVDGWQQETVDNWLPGGGVWLKAHPDQAVQVRFGGEVKESWDGGYHHVEQKNCDVVLAIPYDMYVSGYDSDGVSQLRLWSAKAPGMDMAAFNKGDYTSAMRSANAELISKVLYPNDNHEEGKILRLRQQYFLSSASIHDIINRHLAQYPTLDNLPDKVAIHINDTHPTLAIPELMRILLDECGYTWDAAYDLVRRTFAYTNHTVMSEALEQWNLDLFRTTLPRIYEIVAEIDRRAREELLAYFNGDVAKVNYMAMLGDGQVRMANLCVYVCHSVNGVSKLHSGIIRDSVFHDYFMYKPAAFKNVTNGIAYRRWLLQSNPGLTALAEEAIGEGFKYDAAELSKLRAYLDDGAFLEKLAAVKRENKRIFADYLLRTTGEEVNVDSIFDVQVKRLHEYKRQHLNALHIAAEYLWLKDHPSADFVPKTYLFGAKAAPGYYMAKQIIRLIYALGKVIDADPAMKGKLKVLYLENYSVTMSERLMPASEISEQISLAGTEASGTGNMKFMLNGAPTLGTLDGANIEIAEAAGKENFFQFGMLTHEVDQLRRFGYLPGSFLAGDDVAREVLGFIEKGIDGKNFAELVANLETQDPYMVMADFGDYRRAQQLVSDTYRDPKKFSRMSLANIAGSGIFSADRAVGEYARDIWGMTPIR